MLSHAFLPLVALAAPAVAQYTATYTVGSLPASSEEGQSGTNQCGASSDQQSMCQNAYINAVDDFCLWGPPSTHSDVGDGTSKIGNVEQIVVSYCLKDGYGTRLIPSGTITGAHFVKVESDKVSYVQVTGLGDMTNLLIPAGDYGGELDPHSWTGLGNPQGGLVFTNAFTGNYEQTHEWTSFMSANDFCFRACRDGPNAPGYCEHIYDTLSCTFTIPGSHNPGFDQCEGDPTDEAPGVYDGSTFRQGDPTTPAAHPAGATSACTTFSTIGGGTVNLAAGPTAVAGSTSSSARSVSASQYASASASMSMSMSMSMSNASASASAMSSAMTSASSANMTSASMSSTVNASTSQMPLSTSTQASTTRRLANEAASASLDTALPATSSTAESAASSRADMSFGAACLLSISAVIALVV